jgi:hypothetical protein
VIIFIGGAAPKKGAVLPPGRGAEISIHHPYVTMFLPISGCATQPRQATRDFLAKKTRQSFLCGIRQKAGISHQTLFRIEHGEHHLTLDKLETVLGKLNLRLKDIFRLQVAP